MLYPLAFTKEGSVFLFWNTEPDGSGTSYSNRDSFACTDDTSEDGITLYAQWIKKYTITFELNGEDNGSYNQVALCGQTVTLTPCTFERKFRDFISWNTKADGSGTSYSDGAEFVCPENDENASVILYAQWNAGVYVTPDTIVELLRSLEPGDVCPLIASNDNFGDCGLIKALEAMG